MHQDRLAWTVSLVIGALCALAGLRFGLEVIHPTELHLGSGALSIVSLATLLAGGLGFLVARILQVRDEQRRLTAEFEAVPAARLVKR
jgi:hypothetical protein